MKFTGVILCCLGLCECSGAMLWDLILCFRLGVIVYCMNGDEMIVATIWYWGWVVYWCAVTVVITMGMVDNMSGDTGKSAVLG